MFKDLRIGSQIWLGFGLVLVVAALMAGFATTGLRRSADGFREYRALARASVLSGRVQANMLMASRAARNFLNIRNERSAEIFDERFASAREFALEQQTSMEDPRRLEMSRQLVESLDSYNATSDEVFNLMRRRDAVLRETLNPQGTRMRQNLTEIMVSADRDNDSEAAYVAGRALEHVLLGRVYLLKFLEENRDEDVQRVQAELGVGFKQSYDEMVVAIDNPERRRRLRDFAAARDIYLAAFEEMVSLIETRNTLTTGQMNPLDASIADIAERIKLSLKTDQDALGPVVQESNDATVQAVFIGSSFAVFLASLIAWSMVRAVTRPVAELVETVEDVQRSGDLSKRLAVRGKNELGAVAGTLNGFLTSLEEKAEIAKDVARGALDTKVELLSERDTLGDSFRDMLASLTGKASAVDDIARGDLDTAVELASDRDSLGKSLQLMLSGLQDKARAIDDLSLGRLSVTVAPSSERDSLAGSMNRMIDTLRDVSQQADIISSGDYTSEISPRSTEDTLGIALQRMTATLRKNAADGALRNWVRDGQEKLNDEMRGVLEADDLVSRVLGVLSKHLGAQRGAFYLLDEEAGRLLFAGGYAAGDPLDEGSEFKLGEGLIGQAALDREPIVVEKVPAEYLKIKSSLGDAASHSLAIFPLLYNEQLLGVIELASVEPFEKDKVDFFLSVRESISVALKAAERQNELRELLAQTQRQALYFRTFVDASDPIVLEDLHGNVVDLNREAERAYGWTKEEMLGKPIKTIVPDERYGQADEVLAMCLAGEEVRNVEGLRVSREGKVYDALITLSLLKDESGEAVAIASIAKDVTSLRQSQERLETLNRELEARVRERTAELVDAQETAEAANRAKSEFLSNMSHELRTPLNGVLGYVQILQRDRSLTPMQKQSLDAIGNCGDHLLNLINDVLDLSKIEAGELEVSPEPTDLSHLLQGVRDMVKPKAESKGLHFALEVSPEVPRGLVTDPMKLRQILINLLGNSVKFTAEGAITLLVADVDGDKLRFDVKDTGMGLDAATLEEIFDPFKQAEGGKSEGGTGLGLAISRRIAEALGGRLTAASKTGEGSCFTLILPLVETDELKELEFSAPAPGPDVSFRLPAGETRSVLIADDRDTNRDILEQILTDAGFETVLATDGDEALERLRERDFDVVLLDVHMPRMNGIDVVKEIRRDDALKSLKVFAVTASVFPEFRGQALEAGFDDFLMKPLRVSELAQKLSKFLEIEFENEVEREERESKSEEAVDPVALFKALPDELIQELTEAAKIKNLTKLTGIASSLLEDEQTAPAGHLLERLIMTFDIARLQELADALEPERHTRED